MTAHTGDISWTRRTNKNGNIALTVIFINRSARCSRLMSTNKPHIFKRSTPKIAWLTLAIKEIKENSRRKCKLKCNNVFPYVSIVELFAAVNITSEMLS